YPLERKYLQRYTEPLACRYRKDGNPEGFSKAAGFPIKTSGKTKSDFSRNILQYYNKNSNNSISFYLKKALSLSSVIGKTFLIWQYGAGLRDRRHIECSRSTIIQFVY